MPLLGLLVIRASIIGEHFGTDGASRGLIFLSRTTGMSSSRKTVSGSIVRVGGFGFHSSARGSTTLSARPADFQPSARSWSPLTQSPPDLGVTSKNGVATAEISGRMGYGTRGCKP